GIPFTFSETLLAVMVVLFAGTTMDSGLRLQTALPAKNQLIKDKQIGKMGKPLKIGNIKKRCAAKSK
ncbi:MAG: hypothetical protein OXF23_04205, partial [Candidatus Dadabacteria bacterium]|nr:hypothetical protein [Candidatus Dadabacteria bacterium]